MITVCGPEQNSCFVTLRYLNSINDDKGNTMTDDTRSIEITNPQIDEEEMIISCYTPNHNGEDVLRIPISDLIPDEWIKFRSGIVYSIRVTSGVYNDVMKDSPSPHTIRERVDLILSVLKLQILTSEPKAMTFELELAIDETHQHYFAELDTTSGHAIHIMKPSER